MILGSQFDCTSTWAGLPLCPPGQVGKPQQITCIGSDCHDSSDVGRALIMPKDLSTVNTKTGYMQCLLSRLVCVYPILSYIEYAMITNGSTKTT